MGLQYVTGNLLEVTTDAKRMIPHVCNDVGAWGAGFVVSLSKKWREPAERYLSWYSDGQYIVKTPHRGTPILTDKPPLTAKEREIIDKTPIDGLPGIRDPLKMDEKIIPFKLGMVQYVPIPSAPGTIVCNMIAQQGLISRTNIKPIRYAALVRCMERIETAVHGVKNVEIHAPKFGAKRGGGDWNLIEQLINEIWVDKGLKVIIYEFDEKSNNT